MVGAVASTRYLVDPLPGLVRDLREQLYPPLAGIANAGQRKPAPLILHYEHLE